MSPREDIAGSFPRKIAIATRLFGKELQRNKLNWFDLRRADYRLGEKAYATGTAYAQAELVSRLNGVTEHITQLQRQEIQAATTFGDNVKAFASKVGKTVQISALQRKRRRILRRLGANLRQSAANSSLVEETQLARGVADRVSSVETEISQLAPQTYPWARRPLLLVCLLLLLAAIGGTFALRHKLTPALAQQRGGPGGSSLSDAQMKKMLAQQQTFQQQLLEMQAEAHRTEAEQTQARIAAAERQYKEQRDRERAEAERRQREAAAERDRVATAERARAEEKQREEERRIAAEKAKQEEQRQREAQEQRAKAEAVARAEQQSKQDVRKVAQAFNEALERNDMSSASSLAIGDEKQLALAKAQHDFARSFVRMQLARDKKFGGNQAITFFDPSWAKAEEHVEGDKATVKNGLVSCRLEKRAQTWKVDLGNFDAADVLTLLPPLVRDISEITRNIEKGDYKSDKEVQEAFEAKVIVSASSAQPTSPAVPQSDNAPLRKAHARSEDSLAVERYLRSRLVGGITENQIVELSDLIAEKVNNAGFSDKERSYLFRGTGNQRQFQMEVVHHLQTGDQSPPSTKAAAKQLNQEITEMFPPRAVFKRPIWEHKPLPPIEERINQGHRSPGSLVEEHLETFSGAIHELAESKIGAQPRYTGETPLGYLNQVASLKATDVLCCKYQGEYVDSWSHPYYFWYREAPGGLDELVKTLPNDHPIRLIGPPRYEAPANLELAMKANVETAETLKKRLAEEKARAEKEACTPKGTSYERGRDLVFKALGVAFAFGAVLEIEAQHDAAIQEEELQKLIAASGGGKVLCPKCNGRKRVLRIKTDLVSTNPYVQGTQEWKDYEQSWPGLPKTKVQSTEYYEKCDRCDGKGWVDK